MHNLKLQTGSAQGMLPVSCFTYKKSCSFGDPEALLNTRHRRGARREVTDLQVQGVFAVCSVQMCKNLILLLSGHLFPQDFLLSNTKGS